MLMSGPVAIILLLLCVQHGLHVGGGSGRRRVGRRLRLLGRGTVALLIAALPLLAFLPDEGHAACGESTGPPPAAPLAAPPAATAALPAATAAPPAAAAAPPPGLLAASPPPQVDTLAGVMKRDRWLFISLLLGLLFAQLAFELFGRKFRDEQEPEGSHASRHLGVGYEPASIPDAVPDVVPDARVPDAVPDVQSCSSRAREGLLQADQRTDGAAEHPQGLGDTWIE
mmetsp:Transcript_26346/g.59742  ORF Transcript_26346/g.59742 Transcript_26346/m.59742 type:complete len:227 (-) Transcript_26346:191-871(-)